MAITIKNPGRPREATPYTLQSCRNLDRAGWIWRRISRQNFIFRRRHAVLLQRQDEGHFKIDHYHSRLILYVVLLMCLSLSDGFLTLYLIEKEIYELNPIMAYLLCWGPISFITGKLLLTGFGVTCLVIASNSYIFGFKLRAKTLMSVMIALYSTVILWSTYLALTV